MSDFTFAELSPDMILAALEQCGIFPQSGLLALNSYENRVYQFLSDEQKRYVVKFYRQVARGALVVTVLRRGKRLELTFSPQRR